MLDKLRKALNRKEVKGMAKTIKGVKYYLVDVIASDDIIYEVYQNDRDEVVYLPIDIVR